MPQADSPNPTDLSALRRDLRDCFEGCIPFRDAIQIGAADYPDRKALLAPLDPDDGGLSDG
jgi:hypothetical protein